MSLLTVGLLVLMAVQQTAGSSCGIDLVKDYIKQEVRDQMSICGSSKMVKDYIKDEVETHLKGINIKAFHAQGSSTTVSIQKGQRIPFPVVITKSHVMYSASNSTFTCDDHALYYFYVTLDSWHGDVWFNIVQDGHAKGIGYSGQGSSQVGSIYAIIRCSPGSHVWVQQGNPGTPVRQGMHGVHGQFGGFKI